MDRRFHYVSIIYLQLIHFVYGVKALRDIERCHNVPQAGPDHFTDFFSTTSSDDFHYDEQQFFHSSCTASFRSA